MALLKFKITSKFLLFFVMLVYVTQSFGMSSMLMAAQAEQSSVSGCHGSGHVMDDATRKSHVLALKCCSKKCNMASCHPVCTMTSLVSITISSLSSRQAYRLLESHPSTIPSSLYRPPIIS